VPGKGGTRQSLFLGGEKALKTGGKKPPGRGRANESTNPTGYEESEGGSGWGGERGRKEPYGFWTDREGERTGGVEEILGGPKLDSVVDGVGGGKALGSSYTGARLKHKCTAGTRTCQDGDNENGSNLI